jgi:hypothetical protein
MKTTLETKGLTGSICNGDALCFLFSEN